ncbi:DUF6786 family protein [Flammeovirga aprica]|uniref:Uncharacterized protein n=1 Tax=Flammeovirga aprica JL-4 TaxID=694437 RepID=A0A7X9RUY8_9BACT|nr:DUF6786 family protein [Flammeovirga aprica]NME69114.1 hypothetical protein [Flammeovirga aprica JL-4]
MMNNNSKLLFSVFFLFLFSNCQLEKNYTKGSFGADIQFLEKYIDDLTILGEGNHLVAVSPKFQGRVFTTTTKGYEGRSIGFFNKELMASEGGLRKMSKLGGESRMWFGPEVNEFSVFFPPYVERSGENMQVSEALDTLFFQTAKINSMMSSSSNQMKIENNYGTVFNLMAERNISYNQKDQIEDKLKIQIPQSVDYVSFSTVTTIKSLDERKWEKGTGLLPIWEIGCMLPSDNQWAIVPTNTAKLDTVTNYFTEQKGRVTIKDGIVFYKVDAKYLNKMGLPRENIKPIMGSYSPEYNLLNIVTYSFENDSLYVSSDWESSKNYEGDVMNIFNGEVTPSLDRNWPFFEFESFSAAKELQKSEELKHRQTVYHFEGSKDDLSLISEKVLGVHLSQLPSYN